jgi:hypothetical protein
MNGKQTQADVRSTDLVGDPLPETPSMTAPLPWRVFRMNDCEWWVARTLAEAMGQYLIQTGIPAAEAFDGERELTDEEMDRLHYIDIDENERPVKESRRTFRDELAQRVSAGLSMPELFACTEY